MVSDMVKHKPCPLCNNEKVLISTTGIAHCDSNDCYFSCPADEWNRHKRPLADLRARVAEQCKVIDALAYKVFKYEGETGWVEQEKERIIKEARKSIYQSIKPQEVINKLDLRNKQSIVDFLFQIQGGFIYCRRGATEIQKRIDIANREEN